jgi:hypothetical protein
VSDVSCTLPVEGGTVVVKAHTLPRSWRDKAPGPGQHKAAVRDAVLLRRGAWRTDEEREESIQKLLESARRA